MKVILISWFFRILFLANRLPWDITIQGWPVLRMYIFKIILLITALRYQKRFGERENNLLSVNKWVFEISLMLKNIWMLFDILRIASIYKIYTSFCSKYSRIYLRCLSKTRISPLDIISFCFLS